MSIKEIVKKATKEKPTSSLEELLEREKREKAAELERLKIERMVEEERKRLEELRSEGKPKETEEKELGLEDLGLSTITIRELAKLPDDERNRVIQTWAMIKSADKVQSGILLPLLIGYAKANPGSPQMDLVQFAKVMADQIKTGIEMAKETTKGSKPSAPTYDPIKLIETMGTIWAEKFEKPLEELIGRLQPQPSPFERILMDDQLYARAKEIGLFGPRIPETTSDPKIQFEIEKLRDERERWKEQLRDERERWYAEFKAKQEMEERRWQVVENLFMKGPLGNMVTTLGGAAASKISGTPAAPPKPIMVQCPQCGGTFYASSDAKVVLCPHCNAVLKSVPPGGSEAEAEQVSEQQQQTDSTSSKNTE